MNGAIAVPAVKTMITAKKRSTTINGNSQNFFLTFKNCQSSLMNSIFDRVNLIRRCEICLGIGMIPVGKNRICIFFKLLQSQRVLAHNITDH